MLWVFWLKFNRSVVKLNPDSGNVEI